MFKKTMKEKFFTPEIAKKLIELGEIASANFRDNEKRIANALYEALEIVTGVLIKEGNGHVEKLAKKEFRGFVGLSPEEAYEEFYVACLNTGQYDRALQMIDSVQKSGLIEEDDLIDDRVELLARNGRAEEAEKLLIEKLEKDPNNVWTYIALGDLYFMNQVQDEKQNIERAEHWYYKAYDGGMGDVDIDGGADLLERLGDACIERLRRRAEDKLLAYLEQKNIGAWKTLAQLRESIRLTGLNSVLMHHLENEIMRVSDSIEEANKDLRLLIDFYNLSKQNERDGFSPFELSVYTPLGTEELRLRDEMNQEISKWMEKAKNAGGDFGAIEAQSLSDMQTEFYSKKDSLIGKRRWSIIKAERKKTKKQFENGELIWTGFTVFRNTSELPKE